MVWGGRNEQKLKVAVERLRAEAGAGAISNLMGFNEPDKRDQSNMTVEQTN